MSGLEIAGVVLGAFPVVLEGIKYLDANLGRAKYWWKFETEFRDFVAQIEYHQIRFSQNLDLLFEPLDLPENFMRQVRRGEYKWDDREIQNRLYDRLGEEAYGWYMDRLLALQDTMNEVIALLPIKDGKVCYIEADKWDFELKRLRLSFSRRKTMLMDKLENDGTRMSEVLKSQTQTIDSRSRRRKSSHFIKCALKRRRYAQMAHSAISSTLKCCLHAHRCGILLERRPEETEDAVLNILFPVPSGLRRIEIECKALGSVEETVIPTNGQLSALRKEAWLKPKFDALKKMKHSSKAGAIAMLNIVNPHMKKSALKKRFVNLIFE